MADPDTYDQYVGAEVELPKGDVPMNAKVHGRTRQADGTLLGKAHANPILDTRTYEVEFADGHWSKGNQYLLLAGIINHSKDSSAVEKSDMYIKRGSNLQLRRTTKGWSLCVAKKYGSNSWERLASLKESNQVEIADYAVA